MAKISDLIDGSNPLYPGVIQKLNCSNAISTTDAERWIVSAIKNITDNYPFEELCISAPFIPLDIGISRYDIDTFYPVGYNGIVTRVDSFILQLDIYSGTSVPLRWRTYNFINPLSQIQGMVIYYTVYGTNQSVTAGQQQIIFGFQPQQAWNVQMNFQEKHPFDVTIGDTVVMVPDAWLDVIVGAAGMIGAEELRMSDKQQNLKMELYGDPDNRAEPGLIKRLLSSRAQMSNVNERQFNFIAGEGRRR